MAQGHALLNRTALSARPVLLGVPGFRRGGFPKKTMKHLRFGPLPAGTIPCDISFQSQTKQPQGGVAPGLL
jgi:hypothetical protein